MEEPDTPHSLLSSKHSENALKAKHVAIAIGAARAGLATYRSYKYVRNMSPGKQKAATVAIATATLASAAGYVIARKKLGQEPLHVAREKAIEMSKSALEASAFAKNQAKAAGQEVIHEHVVKPIKAKVIKYGIIALVILTFYIFLITTMSWAVLAWLA